MSTQTKERVGFFRAFFGTCAGTEIFDVLVQHSLLRTLLHLLLLVIFCSFFVTAAQGPVIREAVEKKRQAFLQEFGAISAADPARPTREPERARSLDLAFLKIDYRPEFPQDLPSVGAVPLLLWTPRCPVLFFRNGEQLMALLPEDDDEFQVLHTADSSAFRKKLDSVKEEDTREILKKMNLPEMFSAENICTAYKIAFFCVFGLTALLLTLILCTTLALIYGATGMRARRTIRTGEIFRIAVYTGFPVMAVACFFPAFDLPLLHFESAYAIGLSVYMMVVIICMESRRRGTSPQIR